MRLKIFTPLQYLKLNNNSLNTYRWYLPLSLAILICLIALILPENVNIYNENGLIRSINRLLSILVPFNIISLVAIASLKSENLDNRFAGDPMSLTVRRSGKNETEELSRRKFLCLLFAYSAFVAFLIICVGELAILLRENFIIIIANEKALNGFKFVFMFFYAFAIGNLVSTTLLGLHYLADRIHRP